MYNVWHCVEQWKRVFSLVALLLPLLYLIIIVAFIYYILSQICT